MEYKICKRLKFDYGHRVMHHESKCITPHGHQGVVYVYARAKKLDNLGRVIDFSELKTRVGGWIDTFWDHAFICNEEDRTLIDALATVSDACKPTFLMQGNPTAENLAQFLLYDVCSKLFEDSEIEVYKIQFWETETSFAEAELS